MKTWQQKVLELEQRGWSLTAIAHSSGASIGAISDLKQGRTKEPRADVALQIHHLHSTGATPPDSRRGTAAKAGAAAEATQVVLTERVA